VILTRPRFRDAYAVFEQPTSLRVTAASLNYAAAEPLYRKALEIWRRPLGEAHPDFAENRNNKIAMSDNRDSYKLSD
jgi:hypothetical protein